MADPLSIGASTNKVDISKWKKLTPKEILKEQGKGEEIPPELITWAQQMAAISKIPDDVTYEMVDGDVGIDALSRLGLEEEPLPEDENAQAPTKTEEPDAVKDPTLVEEEEPPEDENIFANPKLETESKENETKTEDELSLSDTNLTTDPETIRKRKERKGLQR